MNPTNPVIQQVNNASGIAVPTPQTGAQKGEDFAQKLMDVMNEVNDAQQNAGQMQKDFITGQRPVEYHDLMIQMEKANTTMQLTMAVRNKMLDAYQEIDRMQV
jgi:flagellar hook-basal body complex protein FliE